METPERRSFLADRLDQRFRLAPDEREVLVRLEEQRRTLKRGTVIRRENDDAGELLIVRRGRLYSSALLDNGCRQILRLYFPGDLAGMACAAFGRATETLVVLIDAEVSTIDRSLLSRLFTDRPRLAAIFYLMALIERVSLADRLTAVGQLPARARVAGLLIEIVTRLRLLDPAIGDRFALGLTQEEIGDITGLTAVHVNRMLRLLADDGLIERDDGRVRILAEDRLRSLANYVDREQQIDAAWLPAIG